MGRLVPGSIDWRNVLQIATFDGLLEAMRQQAEPQRLLLVFTVAELPEGASAEERARFEAGQGGALVPYVCVDKATDELASFAAVLEESRAFDEAWAIVFAAALAGKGGKVPTSGDADEPMERMVAAIRAGRLDGLVAFDRTGEAVNVG
jgi:hypothetical protein